MLFKCGCGGVLLVQEIESFPKDLSTKEQLHYIRKCKVICKDCGNLQESFPYDSPEQDGVQ